MSTWHNSCWCASPNFMSDKMTDWQHDNSCCALPNVDHDNIVDLWIFLLVESAGEDHFSLKNNVFFWEFINALFLIDVHILHFNPNKDPITLSSTLTLVYLFVSGMCERHSSATTPAGSRSWSTTNDFTRRCSRASCESSSARDPTELRQIIRRKHAFLYAVIKHFYTP